MRRIYIFNDDDDDDDYDSISNSPKLAHKVTIEHKLAVGLGLCHISEIGSDELSIVHSNRMVARTHKWMRVSRSACKFVQCGHSVSPSSSS